MINASMIGIALGIFRFGITDKSYQALQRSAPFKYGRVNRAGRMPALQFNGPDTKTVTLEGAIWPGQSGALRHMELMEAVAGLGRPMLLVDGLGFIWQSWCIENIEVTKTLFLPSGAPRKIEFNVTLSSYGGDRA